MLLWLGFSHYAATTIDCRLLLETTTATDEEDQDDHAHYEYDYCLQFLGRARRLSSRLQAQDRQMQSSSPPASPPPTSPATAAAMIHHHHHHHHHRQNHRHHQLPHHSRDIRTAFISAVLNHPKGHLLNRDSKPCHLSLAPRYSLLDGHPSRGRVVRWIGRRSSTEGRSRVVVVVGGGVLVVASFAYGYHVHHCAQYVHQSTVTWCMVMLCLYLAFVILKIAVAALLA